MFAKELTFAGHVRRFVVVAAGPVGWEVREEQDSAVVRRMCYSDWHRVERALREIAAEIDELQSWGWRAR